MRYSIGQFAEILGVSASTVRYYESEGLIPTAERRHGCRVYYNQDVDIFRLVQAARNLGYSISEIKHLADARKDQSILKRAITETAGDKYNLVTKKIEKLQLQKKAFEQIRACGCDNILTCQAL